MLPCLAQLTILSAVAKAYSTPFLGVSSDNWFEPCFAKLNAALVSTAAIDCDSAEEAARDVEGAGRASCEVELIHREALTAAAAAASPERGRMSDGRAVAVKAVTSSSQCTA